MEIKYGVPVEVTLKQYKVLSRDYSDIVAYREEVVNGKTKYWIKLMLPKYRKDIEEILEQTK